MFVHVCLFLMLTQFPRIEFSGTMGRKNEAQMEEEKEQAARRVTAQIGKELGSMPESEEERRQQTLAMLRKKAQAKRDGKRVMVEESVADIAHKQAPPKRARAPRSTKLRALVLEKGTKDGANEPAPTIRTKAPRKTIEPPPIEQEGANAEEEHSEGDSEAEYDPNSTESFNDKRDRQKTPTEEELLEQMRKRCLLATNQIC